MSVQTGVLVNTPTSKTKLLSPGHLEILVQTDVLGKYTHL